LYAFAKHSYIAYRIILTAVILY